MLLAGKVFLHRIEHYSFKLMSSASCLHYSCLSLIKQCLYMKPQMLRYISSTPNAPNGHFPKTTSKKLFML